MVSSDQQQQCGGKVSVQVEFPHPDLRAEFMSFGNSVPVPSDGRIELYSGIYRIAVTRFGIACSELVIIENDETIIAPVPELSNALLLSDGSKSASVRAGLIKTVEKVSRSTNTGTQVPESALLVAGFHEGGGFTAEQLPFKKIAILDSNGEELVGLAQSGLVNQLESGSWVANIPLNAGRYLIRIVMGKDNSTASLFPIELISGRQHQFFALPARQQGHLFAAARAVTSSLERGFDSTGIEPLFTEFLLYCLNSCNSEASPELPERALEMLCTGNFEDPVFGLIGGHVLLKNEATRHELSALLARLDQLCPSSIDLRALRLAEARVLGETIDCGEIDWPPLLTQSWDEIVSGTHRGACTIKPDSMADGLSPRRFVGQQLISWDSVPQSQFTWLANLPVVQLLATKSGEERQQMALWIAKSLQVTTRDVEVYGSGLLENAAGVLREASLEDLQSVEESWKNFKYTLK